MIRDWHMIRPRGIAIIIMAIVLFVLAGVTRVGWLLLFDAVLWGVVAVSAAAPWLAIGRLKIQRRIVAWQSAEGAPGPTEGDSAQLDLKLQNTGLFPCAFVTVRYGLDGDAIAADSNSLLIAWLGRNKRLSSSLDVKLNRRGLHKLPQLRVEASLPFGMFRRTKRAGDETELLVFPRVYPVSKLDMLASSGASASPSLRARSGDEIIGSRGYIQGDPWQSIHWRNTARTSWPQVKEFERTPDKSLAIAFSAQNSIEQGEESLEHAIKIAASVGDFVCKTGGAVSLLAGDIRLDTSDSPEFLRALALLEASTDSGLAALLRKAPPGADMLAVVLETDAEGLRALAQLPWGQQRIVAVVLRGFDPRNVTMNAAEELRRAGIAAVECRPGEVERAIVALEEASQFIVAAK